MLSPPGAQGQGDVDVGAVLGQVSSEAEEDAGAAGTPPRPPPSPFRTNWTRLVPPSVLTGHVSLTSAGGAGGTQGGVSALRGGGGGAAGPGAAMAQRALRLRGGGGGLAGCGAAGGRGGAAPLRLRGGMRLLTHNLLAAPAPLELLPLGDAQVGAPPDRAGLRAAGCRPQSLPAF